MQAALVDCHMSLVLTVFQTSAWGAEYAEAEVVLLPREPGAPKMTNRVQKWTILMSQNAGLEACIARVTGWDKAWIPERCGHPCLSTRMDPARIC